MKVLEKQKKVKTLRKSITKDRGNYFERQKFRKSRKQKSSEFPEKKVQTKCFLKGKKVQKVQKKTQKVQKNQTICVWEENKFRKFRQKVQKVRGKSSDKMFLKSQKVQRVQKKKFRKFREKKGSESFRKKFVFLVQKVFRQHSSNKLQKNKKKANLIQKNICRRLKSKIKWYCEDGFLILRYTFTYNLLITCLQPLLLEIKLCNFLAKVRWNIYFPTFVTFCYVCNFFLTFVTFW